MQTPAYQKLLDAIAYDAIPITSDNSQLDALVNFIGDAQIVLLGEATHGTQEFYQMRAALTQRLIAEKGFMAVTIEGDWPDAYHINRYLQGRINDAQEALSIFERFPSWMWRNTVVYDFIKWLRTYNDQNPDSINLYGLDLYSLHRSVNTVVDYLEKIDPKAAKHARERYACIDHSSSQNYGYLTNKGLKHDCMQAVTEQLLELHHHANVYIQQDDLSADEEYFYILQNARVVKNAETYYRIMFDSQKSSWNLRDRHMAQTLNAITAHLERRCNKPAKIIVWAHNSHLGDARATEMAEGGEINLGQLVREQYSRSCVSIGFSTYTGTVTAASHWGAPARYKHIQPGIPSSYEQLFHDVEYSNFFLNLMHGGRAEQYLHTSRLQRAIGVIYLPETERISHYFYTRLPYQFDAIIHLDKTTALKPLGYMPIDQENDELETYPTGI